MPATAAQIQTAARNYDALIAAARGYVTAFDARTALVDALDDGEDYGRTLALAALDAIAEATTRQDAARTALLTAAAASAQA